MMILPGGQGVSRWCVEKTEYLELNKTVVIVLTMSDRAPHIVLGNEVGLADEIVISGRPGSAFAKEIVGTQISASSFTIEPKVQ
jgi:hypothetical protein